MEKKYNLKLVEILSAYNLYQFETKTDAVQVAQKIVENKDGFAFPNIIREQFLRSVPVTMPIKDKYYQANYQWYLKNTGQGFSPYKKFITTLKNADIRFEEAMQWIVDEIKSGNLKNFDATTKIAIMDSGVDPTHPDLKEKLDKGWDVINKKEGGNPDTPPANSGAVSGYTHGTNCAGVAAAQGNTIGTTGVCPWCGIYPVHFLSGAQGSGMDEKGYMTVYEKYVADPKIVAINCSFGPPSGMGKIPMSSGEQTAILNFLKNGRNGKGGAVVFASGNDNVDSSYEELLGYIFKFKRNGKDVQDKVVVVNASSAWDTRVAYSNFGKDSDIIAPSLSINPLLGIATSTIQGVGDLDSDYTLQFSGTSSATPVVTGALGVIFSVNPDLTLEEGLNVLFQGADKINPKTGFWKNGHSVKFGYGRLNLLKSVRLAAGKSSCETTKQEIQNNIDDNCDGFVDEGFYKDISKVGKECSTDADCETSDFKGTEVECVKTYNSYKFLKGYCTIKNIKFSCPDGTEPFSDTMKDTNCFKECNEDNPCEANQFCTKKVLGICLPKCSSNDDCNKGAHCETTTGECKLDPSEPGGPCESREDCKYGAMCLTQMPGGFCLKQCADGNDDYCGTDTAKCVKVPGQGQTYEICLPTCEKDSDCRSPMICHPQYSGKTNVCSMKCRTDSDCFDFDATCHSGRCYIDGEYPDETTTQDEDNEKADNDNLINENDSIVYDNDENVDSIKDSENNELDNEKADTNSSGYIKKTSGCSLILL